MVIIIIILIQLQDIIVGIQRKEKADMGYLSDQCLICKKKEVAVVVSLLPTMSIGLVYYQ